MDNGPATIPRILHFIWLGTNLPDWVQSNIDTFRKHAPDFAIRIWRDADLEWLRNRRIFLDAPTLQGKANIARYEILLRNGGYYIDADFECVRSLDPIEALGRKTGLLLSPEYPGLWNNGVMAATPGHPFLESLVAQLPAHYDATRHLTSVESSGPGMLTAAINLWNPTHESWFTDIPRTWVYPYHWDKLHRAAGPWADCVIMVHQWNQAIRGPATVKPPSFGGRLNKRMRQHIHPRWMARQARDHAQRTWRYATFQPNGVALGDDVILMRDREQLPIAFSATDQHVHAHLYTRGVSDPDFHTFLGHVLRGSDVYVDVGANIGQFVLTAASHLSRYGRVWALEPNPEAARLLERNVYMRRMCGKAVCQVQVLQVAAGASSGLGDLAIPTFHDGRASMHRGTLDDVADAQVRHLTVPVVSLDELLRDLSHIRLLKIDVEGSEVDVLAGAEHIIGNGLVDYVDLEFMPAHMKDDFPRVVDWCRLQQQRGATFWTLGHKGRLLRVNLSELLALPRPLHHLIIRFKRAADEGYRGPSDRRSRI